MIVLELQLNEFGRFEGGGKRAGEFVVSQVNLLERIHTLERIRRYLAGEVIIGEVERLDSADLLPIRHGAVEVVAHEADRPHKAEGVEGVDVDLAPEVHLLQLQTPHVAVVAEHAHPVAALAGAGGGGRIPVGEGRLGIDEGGFESDESDGLILGLGKAAAAVKMNKNNSNKKKRKSRKY